MIFAPADFYSQPPGQQQIAPINLNSFYIFRLVYKFQLHFSKWDEDCELLANKFVFALWSTLLVNTVRVFEKHSVPRSVFK